jgi:hypothetical protein
MPTLRSHGPENAEFEIRKAYNIVIDGAIPYFWQNRSIPGVDPGQALAMYKHAFNSHRKGNRLAAERWARAAKHLARAFWAEAKIAYLETHDTDLPFLEGAPPEAYNLHEQSDTTADLLNSVSEHVPPGFERMPEQMSHYLARARKHLELLDSGATRHELERAERIKAAYEYGRVLEIMSLAYEAEAEPRAKSA